MCARIRSRLRLALAGCAALAFGSPAYAGTARRDPPLLFGAGPHVVRPPVAIDPELPTGAPIAASLERPRSLDAACSPRLPVCVQRGLGVSGDRALAALQALEAAYERIVYALALPAPLADDGHGGSDALDWYLDDNRTELSVEPDAVRFATLDSAAAFCLGGSADSWLVQRDATLCVAEAVAKRLDPAEVPALERAFATELWWLSGRITSLDAQAIDDAQAEPERAIAGRSAKASAAAPLFLDFLELARSSQNIGALTASLFSAGVGSTPSTASAWNNEPDVFDVLRHSLDEDTVKTASLFGEYAVARAFLGDRDDGAHPPYEEWAGAFARPRYDWVLKYSSLPRRVHASRPLEPTGSEYIWIDLDEVPLGASLGFQAEWEAPVAFKWVLVSLDAEGREVARVDVPFQERAQSSEARVVNLLDARAVLAIGINMGGVDLAHPFDPDLDPFEPNSCTVYFVSM
ncbi:MAG TPA: hypothetical protein VGM44_14850 [Polyangiaceae bacterium]